MRLNIGQTLRTLAQHLADCFEQTGHQVNVLVHALDGAPFELVRVLGNVRLTGRNWHLDFYVVIALLIKKNNKRCDVLKGFQLLI